MKACTPSIGLESVIDTKSSVGIPKVKQTLLSQSMTTWSRSSLGFGDSMPATMSPGSALERR